MNLHVIVVAYGLAEDLLNLYRTANGDGLHWHLFLHSQYPDVVAACEELAKNSNVTYYPHGINRGLATSWNDGLVQAWVKGADAYAIANDDVLISYADVKTLYQVAMSNRDKYLITGNGLDMSTGERKSMQFAFAVINPIALETIGYFDENLFPIYFEDADWHCRAKSAGLQALNVEDTDIIHVGSKTRHTIPENNEQHEITFAANREYYVRKWGGDVSGERYPTPFNDPALGLRISAGSRRTPYGDYNRTDRGIVKV